MCGVAPKSIDVRASLTVKSFTMHKHFTDMMVNLIISKHIDIIQSMGTEAYINTHMAKFDDFMDEYYPTNSHKAREEMKKDIRSEFRAAIDKKLLLTINLN